MALAFACFPLNPCPPLSPPSLLPSSSSSSSIMAVHSAQRSILTSSNFCCSVVRPSAGRLRCSDEEFPEDGPIEFETKEKDMEKTRKRRKRKPRPSFNAQTLERWPVKISSSRSALDQKFQTSLDAPFSQPLDECGAPVMEFGASNEKVDEERGGGRLRLIIEKLNATESGKSSDSDLLYESFGNSVDAVPPMANRIVGIPFGMQTKKSAPWAHAAKHDEDGIRYANYSEALVKNIDFGKDYVKPKELNLVVDKGRSFNYGDPINVSLEEEFPVLSSDMDALSCPEVSVPFGEEIFSSQEADLDSKVADKSPVRDDELSEKRREYFVRENAERFNDHKCSSSSNVGIGVSVSSENLDMLVVLNSGHDDLDVASPVPLPWEREIDSMEGEQLQRSNTELAERTIPEPELRRLRNTSLKMKERMTVGPAGVTEAVVKCIHEKWKEVEVIKLRFEGPANLNMKRTHEILEIKTGGVVIWRSGRSVVLYRGMAYQLPCIQTYSKLSDASSSHNPSMRDCSNLIMYNQAETSVAISGSSKADSMTYENLSEGSPATACIDSLLDQLGPRCKDWSGCNPRPVDADLLPGLVPGYKPPFRLLPYKTRRSLRDKEMTVLRRLAGTMPPHFVLGRNRQLQGLAAAIVKLWEKSSIAKIAIKRGIPNTSNERMAEEIKKLTGGVLLYRNKEYIVLYRGNDFMAPSIREVLIEKEKLANIHYDGEEVARLRASTLVADVKSDKGPLVAGTLAETMEAKRRWGKPLNPEESEMAKKNMVLTKHASLVRYLERKLVFAKLKVRKAEKALWKVQEFLQPADLPTDLEIVTDEERALFRTIGLKMKGALLLGRRGIFDGTVENMHLNWKNNELVKILVKGKNFKQVKHIAISLEAESGGVLISLDKTTKGYAIIFYRSKNYQRPQIIKPRNLLTRRQALARSIELQRREALLHHISNLQDQIQMLKSQLDHMQGDEGGNQVLNVQVNLTSCSDNKNQVEDEEEEAFLETYSSQDEEEEASQ
ncbi:CRM-domain containing factor CFM3, chloroplastic/mitochondrial-like [Zingiber officinale]|nr:CRM-domain containing factor CFM3, chloroplastic/mitochondrial-like [Zingiber officinale]XP_042457420.1 CRM-domain containing factor CFM3, chloroplastic/mitochondrial-like [Zingiber officinale]